MTDDDRRHYEPPELAPLGDQDGRLSDEETDAVNAAGCGAFGPNCANGGAPPGPTPGGGPNLAPTACAQGGAPQHF